MILAICVGLVFSAAAWFGAGLGRISCFGRWSFADGPRPVAVGSWIIALAGGYVGLGFAAHHPSIVQVCLISLVIGAFGAAIMSDLALGLIPDIFTIVPLTIFVILSDLGGNGIPAVCAILAGLPFAMLAWVTRGYGMGWGDVKLIALGGAIVGPEESVLVFILASIAAYGVSRLSRSPYRGPVAFGPYLAGGFGVMLILGSRF